MPTRTRYIILNGPPSSGKSSIARETCRHMRDIYPHLYMVQDSFAAPMKHFIAVALSEQYHRLKKDSPMAVLSGRSPREFLIDMSENFLKEHYGDDIFGRLLEYRILRMYPAPNIVLCDDGGFLPEVQVLPRRAVVHVARPGCDFKSDSRSYLPNPDHVLNNTGTCEAWEKAAAYEFASWIARRFLNEYDGGS